ncbi:MAG TPA: IS66 family transposase [Chloroflexota bacterium]|nr:IS66 family transposase [Chloroflexota bacterium]
MSREALEGLSREELIELVLRLGEMVTAAGQQPERIAELERQLAELQAEIGRLSAPKKTAENSSVPPSVGFKANRSERRRRRRGKRRGHPGTSRRRQTPDVLVRCRPSQCQGCGEPLPVSGQRRVGRSQVVELPPVRPVVVEAWQYAARCRGCGTRTKGGYPAGLEPTRTFGPGIEAMLGYFHERHHVGYERLVEVCREVFGLTISEGGIDNALRRLAERARPTYEAIGAQVRAGPVIGSDETSARVAGRNAWHWVFQTPDASYHVIVRRRNADVIAAFLGETRPEAWVSDLWSPQLTVDAATHQICLAHQIRNLTYAAEADGYDGLVWAVELRHLFGRAIHLHTIRETLSPSSFTLRRRRIENAVDRLVFRTFLPDQPDTANACRLQERYQQHRTSLFVFFDRPDVPPTNNASEQDLRPSVIHRKVTGGFRSWAGAAASAILTSLFATARKQGLSFLALLRSIAGPSPLRAAGLPS